MANVVVRTPEGQLLEGPAENLQQLQQSVPGAQVLSEAEATEARRVQGVREEQQGVVPAAVQFGQSFLRGVTPFGLPVGEAVERYVVPKITGESDAAVTERMRIRAEEQQAADVAGETAGFLTSALATGGETAVAKGVGLGARTLTAAGEAATAATQWAAQKARNEAAQRVLSGSISQAIARGTAEGLGLGVGAVARDAVLDRDGELVGQKLLESALLGGATSGLFGALGAGAKAAAEAAGPGTAGALAGGLVGGALGGLPGAAVGAGIGGAMTRRASRNAALLAEHESLQAAERAAREAVEVRAPKPGSPLSLEEIDDALHGKTPQEMATEQMVSASTATDEAALDAAAAQQREHASETLSQAATYAREIDRLRSSLTETSALGMQTRKVLADADEIVMKAERDLPSQMNEVLGALDASQRLTTGAARKAQYVKLATHEGVDGAAAKAGVLPAMQETIDRLEAAAATEGATNASAPLRRLAKEAKAKLAEMSKLGDEAADAGRLAGMLNDFKMDMQKVAARGFGPTANTIDNGLRDELRRNLQERLRLALEDPGIFGEQIAGTQRLGNRSWTNLLTNAQDFMRSFSRLGERSEFDPFEKIALGDSAKLSAFTQGMGAAANADKLALMQTQLPKIIEHLETQSRLYPHGAYAERVQNGIRAARKILDHVSEEKTGSALNAYRTREAAKALQEGMQSQLAMKAASTVPVIGQAVTLLADMQKRVMVQQALDSVVTSYEARVSEAIKGFMAGAEKPGRLVAETVRRAAPELKEVRGREVPPEPVPPPRKTVKETALGEEKASTREVLRQMATVSAAVQGPRLNTLISSAVMPMGSTQDPGLAVTVANAMARAAAFLSSHIPPGALMGPTDNAQPQFARSPLTDSQIAQWRTYVQTVRDPLSVLDDLGKGTVSREQAETLRTVYPALYASIQTRIMGELHNARRPIGYEQRVLLFQLFGTTVDPSLKPEAIRALQSSYKPAQPAPMGAPRATPGRVRGSFSANLRTSSESLAARGNLP